jgi:DNA-binding NtrC family response regulator
MQLPSPQDDYFVPHRFCTLKEVEEWHISQVIRDSYNGSEACRRLGISKEELLNKVKEYDIKVRPYGKDPNNPLYKIYHEF